MIVSWFPVAGRHRGPNENMLLHHVFCPHTLQLLTQAVEVPIQMLHIQTPTIGTGDASYISYIYRQGLCYLEAKQICCN